MAPQWVEKLVDFFLPAFVDDPKAYEKEVKEFEHQVLRVSAERGCEAYGRFYLEQLKAHGIGCPKELSKKDRRAFDIAVERSWAEKTAREEADKAAKEEADKQKSFK